MLDRQPSHSSLNSQQKFAAPQVNGLSEIEYFVDSETVHSVQSEAMNSGSLAAVGMVLQLSDGQIAACNANAERMMGMTAAQMTGWRSTSPDWRVVREDGTPFPGEEHPATIALATGKTCRDVVMGFYQPNGALVWLLLNSQPLFQGSSSQPYGVLTTLTEIPQSSATTQRSLAEPIGSPEPAHSRFSHEVLEYRSHSKDDSRNSSSDRPGNDSSHRIDKRYRTGNGHRNDNDRNENDSHSNGSGSQTQSGWASTQPGDSTQPTFPVQSTLSLLIDENQFLRDREERLRLALEGADLGLWDYDLETDQLVWSNRCKVLFGLPANTSITYDRFLQTVHPEERSAIDAAVQQVVHRSIGGYELEIRLRDELHPAAESNALPSQPRSRWIQLRGNVYRDATGQPLRMVGIAIDITNRQWAIAEQQQAEAQLRDSQQFIQQVADAVPGLLYVYDLIEQQNVYVNQKIQEILGYSATQIEAMSSDLFARLIHPADLSMIPVHHARFDRAQPNEVFECEYRMRNAQGEWRWFLSRDIVFRRTGDGQVWQILGTAQDITERRQIEQSLQDSQSRYAALAQNVPGVIYRYQQFPDDHAVFHYISLDCQELLGVSRAAVLTDARNLYTIVHPDDRLAFQASLRLNLNREHSDTEAQWQHEWRILHSDSSVKWIKGIARAEQYSDGSVLWDGIMFDITAEKHLEAGRTAAELALRSSEERYRYLAEAIPQLIWTANADGGLNDINQRWSDYTGLTLEQAQYSGWLQTVHPDDAPILMQAWLQAQESRSLYQAECRIRSNTGEYRWFLVKAIPVQDDQGNIVKWYGTSTDIDDQKQLALERLRALKLEQTARTAAERSNRIKDELLMMLSHELRTPLNPILGWSQLLQKQELSRDRTVSALQTIERNAQRQLQLVEDLLDVAKVLQGEIRLKPSWVNFAEPIQAAIASIRTMAQAKQIELDTALISEKDSEASQTERYLIWGDGVRLQQITWNLLSNAVKFTPQGGKITVRLDRSAGDVRLQVSDTGVGIDPAFLPHVFERFRQFNSSTTREYGGLGLGLAIVHHLVYLHGGTIEAHSLGRDRGATFTVCFPVAARLDKDAN